MSLSALLIIFSTLVFIKFSEQKRIISNEVSQQEAATAASRTSHWSLPQEKQAPALEELKTMFMSLKVEKENVMLMGGPKEEQNQKGSFIMRSQDLDSGCESIDEHSSSDSGHEDDHSDIEWLQDMEQKQAEYFLDGSISDEESLIEIALIPSGQFVSLQEKDPKLNLNCKLSAKERSQELDASGFMADTGELTGDQEDNLIEIDIHMGSIKYSKNYGAKYIHPLLVRNK